MRKASFVFVALTVALAFSTPLKAQVAWDGPLLVGPETPTGWGIYLVDVFDNILPIYVEPGVAMPRMRRRDRSRRVGRTGAFLMAGILARPECRWIAHV